MEVNSIQQNHDGDTNNIKKCAIDSANDENISKSNSNGDISIKEQSSIKEANSPKSPSAAADVKTNGAEDSMDSNENSNPGNDDIDKLMNAASSICYVKNAEDQSAADDGRASPKSVKKPANAAEDVTNSNDVALNDSVEPMDTSEIKSEEKQDEEVKPKPDVNDVDGHSDVKKEAEGASSELKIDDNKSESKTDEHNSESKVETISESDDKVPETPPIKKGKKRKMSTSDSPVRIQPKRTASAKINFKEPQEIEDEIDDSVRIIKTPEKPKADKSPPKVTVIELGKSSLKLSDILRKENSPGEQTKVFGNSSITISSSRTTHRDANQISINKLPPDVGTSQPILKSKLQTQQKSTQGSQLKSMYNAKTIKLSDGGSEMVKMKNGKPFGTPTQKQIITIPAESPEEPSAIEVIDEKEEYDKLDWETDVMFPYIRPGRFVLPSPNETMSFALCNERLVECASKVTPFLLRFPSIPKVDGYKYEKSFSGESVFNPATSGNVQPAAAGGYFRSSLGNFFMEIGQRLVSEWVQKDLVRSRKRKMEKEGETEASVKSLEAMTNMYEQLKSMNSVFHFRQSKCERCNFKTESSIVLQNHLETPHVFPGTYKYSCTCCDFYSRDLSAILVHMKMFHNIQAKIDPIPLFHQCPLCLYNSDKKQRMYSHVSKCSKSFKMQVNQAPTNESSFPAKSFPPTWIHGQNFQRAFGKPNVVRGQGLPASGYKTMLPLKPKIPLSTSRGRPPSAHTMFPPSTLLTKHPKPILVQDPKTKLFKLLNSSNDSTPKPAQQQRNSNASSNSPITIIKNNPVSQTSGASKSSSFQKPSITLTPVNNSSSNAKESREPTKGTINGLQSITVPYKGGVGSRTFVICEICDGYIRDLEQLRAHMQWMHKVKIHPKMIQNRPPLNCQKCKFRFFTDQGLERHLLGIHGLVTSNMQESANKGEDAGRCSACGKLFQSKLLYHIAKVHKISLKPAHLSYKCTVCAATFTLYKLFEAHVYSKHTLQTPSSGGGGGGGGSNKTATPTAAIEPSSRPGPLCSKKPRPVLPKTASDIATPAKVTRVLPQCPECDKTVFNIERHWKDCHQRPFSVKLCHIEQCHKCLSEFDGFVVIHTDYFDSDSD